jgi:hypothetical protein
MIRTLVLAGSTMLAILAGGWTAPRPHRPVAVNSAIAVDIPSDWVYDTTKYGVVASRDGPLLEAVTVRVIPHKEAFAAAKRASSDQLPPEDLAESYLANLQAGDSPTTGVRVLETTPADVAGQPGFRIHLRYRTATDPSGVEMEQIAVGTALPSGLLLATFDAPALHYFGQYLAAFDAMVATLQRPR